MARVWAVLGVERDGLGQCGVCVLRCTNEDLVSARSGSEARDSRPEGRVNVEAAVWVNCCQHVGASPVTVRRIDQADDTVIQLCV